jgi:cytochrome c556
MRIRSLILVVCAAVAAGSCQSKQPEPAAPAAGQPPYTTTATVKDIMLHVVDPAGDMVWDSVSTVVDKQGLHETVPRTDEDWFKVRNGVITLIEASNLLMIPGRAMAKPGEKSVAPGIELEPAEMEVLVNKDREGWNQRARDLHNISLKVLEVVDKKDAQALFDIGEDLDKACENCHRAYWYPNEKIPDLPSSEPSAAAPSK